MRYSNPWVLAIAIVSLAIVAACALEVFWLVGKPGRAISLETGKYESLSKEVRSMKKRLLAVVAFLVSLIISCRVGSTKLPPTPASTATRSQIATPVTTFTVTRYEELEISGHLKKAEEFRINRDFKRALEEIEKAEQLLEDKSPGNTQYLSLLLAKSNVYAYFERLDEAEATLLKATGIPDETIEILTDSKRPLSREEYVRIADEIHQMASEDDKPGYHIALSLIYNILGDSERLGIEQQRAMDLRTDNKDLSPAKIALGLYKVRGRKIEVHTAIERLENLVQSETENLDYQYQLALHYLYAGWFEEAQEITDKYLELLDKDSDKDMYLLFLFLKMNLEMALGHYEGMKSYEDAILELDPNALDEFD